MSAHSTFPIGPLIAFAILILAAIAAVLCVGVAGVQWLRDVPAPGWWTGGAAAAVVAFVAWLML